MWLYLRFLRSVFFNSEILEGADLKIHEFLPWGLQAVVETAIKSCSSK